MAEESTKDPTTKPSATNREEQKDQYIEALSDQTVELTLNQPEITTEGSLSNIVGKSRFLFA